MRDRSDYFISPEVLHKRLDEQTLSIIDGSWYLDKSRNAAEEYVSRHIPGAVFFDLDAIADQNSALPHMLPPPDVFSDAVGQLGVSDEDLIVIYACDGLGAAARVWWTFRVMGAQNVRILDGGLPAWQAAGFTVSNTIVPTPPATFNTLFDEHRIIFLTELRDLCGTEAAQILDARPAGRFAGETPEPRPGLRSGHMPGAKNLPATDLIENGHLKSREELTAIFRSLDIKPDDAVITTCGSGVTAAILTLGLELAGYKQTRLYDGSWAEWGSLTDTDVIAP